MPRKTPPRFSSALVPFVLTYLRGHGADADALARRYLRDGAGDGQPITLAPATFRSLMADGAKLLGDGLFGLHLAQAMPRGAYGLLEFAVRSAPTARVALEQLARFGALINPAARFWLEPDGGELAVHHRIPDEAAGVGRHGNLFTVARLLVMGRELAGPALMPRRAWFAHPERSCPAELQTFLGTRAIAFGRSSNGLAFHARDLEQPLPGADLELNAVLREHCNRLVAELEPDGVHERTRHAVRALLPKGEVNLALVAKRLHLGERTLQRRLTENGLAFATLVAEVRTELAQQLLAEDTVAVADVARRVGYADVAAFGRAFKRWTGQSPGAFRAAARG